MATIPPTPKLGYSRLAMVQGINGHASATERLACGRHVLASPIIGRQFWDIGQA
jgi:hypothetical protein